MWTRKACPPQINVIILFALGFFIGVLDSSIMEDKKDDLISVHLIFGCIFTLLLKAHIILMSKSLNLAFGRRLRFLIWVLYLDLKLSKVTGV